MTQNNLEQKTNEKKNTQRKRVLIVEDSLSINPLSAAYKVPEIRQCLRESIKNFKSPSIQKLEEFGIRAEDTIKKLPQFIKSVLSGDINKEERQELYKKIYGDDEDSIERRLYSYSIFEEDIKNSAGLLKQYFKEINSPSVLESLSIPIKIRNAKSISRPLYNVIMLSEFLKLDKEKQKKDDTSKQILDNIREYQSSLDDYVLKGISKSGEEHNKKSLCDLLEDPIINKKMQKTTEKYLGLLFKNKLQELGIDAEVDFALDVETALNNLDSRNYDFAITDVGVPLQTEMKYNMPIEKSIDETSKLLKQKYNKIINEEKAKKILEISSIKNANRKYLENWGDIYQIRTPEVNAGNLVTLLARKKGIKTLQYTDNGHYSRAVFSSLFSGNLKPENFYELVKQLEKEKTYSPNLKIGNFQIGSKNLENYFKVVEDFIKEDEIKLSEKRYE